MSVLQLSVQIKTAIGPALWLVDGPWEGVDDFVTQLRTQDFVRVEILDTHIETEPSGDKVWVVHRRREGALRSAFVLAVGSSARRVVEYVDVTHPSASLTTTIQQEGSP